MLVCFESHYFIFNFILLNMRTKSRRFLLHLNLNTVNHVCLGFLNFFFCLKVRLFLLYFFQGEGGNY